MSTKTLAFLVCGLNLPHSGYPALHSLIMRASPVHASAVRALPELVVLLRNTQWNKIPRSFFACILQKTVTSHAPCKRPDFHRQFKSLQHLGNLLPAVCFPQPITMHHL